MYFVFKLQLKISLKHKSLIVMNFKISSYTCTWKCSKDVKESVCSNQTTLTIE